MAAAGFAHIETPRLRLVPVGEAAPEEVAHAIGNSDVARWLGRVPYPYRSGDAAEFIAANAGLEGRVWFIRDEAGALVGGIGIDGELGYWLARPAWGRGYATEAGDAAVDAHFADPAAGDLASGHFPGNARSAGVLAKLGFRYDGRRQMQSRALGQAVEIEAMVLTRNVWRDRRVIRIATPRLVMRPLSPRDAPALAEMTGLGPAELDRWIAEGRFRGRPGYRLGVERRGALLGVVGVLDGRVTCMAHPRRADPRLAEEATEAFVADVFARFPDVAALALDDAAGGSRLLDRAAWSLRAPGRWPIAAPRGPA